MCADPAFRRPLPDPVPVPAGVDESFFPGLDAHPLLSERERSIVAAVDALLRRHRPSYVTPSRTAVLRQADDGLRLEVRHAETTTRIAIEVGPDDVALRWTGGELRAAWGPQLEGVLVAFLLGRDELLMHLRWGCVHTVDTFVWDEGAGDGRRISHRVVPGRTPALVRRLPGASRVERMSVSFDRAEALGPSSRGARPVG